MNILNKTLFIFLIFGFARILPVESGQYAVNLIPSGLRKDANAVIRINHIKFEIKNERKAYLEIKKAVTIFKKDEENYGHFIEHYNQFIEIDDLEGNIYDVDGNLIRELESKDIKDYSAFSSYSLYEDSRIKTAGLYHNKYPYTVEFIYEISFDGYISFPTWYSRNSIDPVEKSIFETTVQGNNLRYWCNQDSVKPLIIHDDDETTYIWQAENLPKLSRDVIGEYIEDVATVVEIAPSDFEIEDYPGNMSTWKQFGLWYKKLYEDRNKLPESAIKEITALYKNDEDVVSKINKLYKYMQGRTRYVSIQLGIGGWQPYDAEFVHTRGYGDCKALANYMTAILDAAGITAYPVLINNGKHRYPMITEFSSNQFNHVIVSVPAANDTVWLECTNQSLPAGFLGSGNENRNALMITPEGGVVVTTPQTTSLENLQQRKAEIKIKIDGNVDVKSCVKWSGNNRAHVQNMLDDNSPEDQQKWVLNSMEKPDCKINLLKFNSDEDNSAIHLSFNYVLPRYATVSNNRMFFYPNMMERRTWVPNDVTNRMSPVIFSFPYLDIDTISYEFPVEYKIESLPAEVSFKSSFGDFTSKVVSLSDSQLMYIRKMEIKDYSIPAENYSDYRKFYVDIVKSDRSQVVLIKR